MYSKGEIAKQAISAFIVGFIVGMFLLMLTGGVR